MPGDVILDLPFTFQVNFKPHRKRLERERVLRGVTPVRIQTLDADEAPIAAELERVDWVAKYGEKAMPGGAPRQIYRRVGDTLFTRYAEKPLTVGEFTAGLDLARQGEKPGFSQSSYPTTGMKTDVLSALTPEQFADIEEKARVVSDDRAVRESAAQTILPGKIAVIDGEIWTTIGTREPHFKVYQNGFEGDVRVEVDMSEEALGYVAFFRLDRRDDAFAYAAVLAETLGVGVADNTPVIHEIRPDLLQMDDVRQLARQMLCAMTWKQFRLVDGNEDARMPMIRDLHRYHGRLTDSQVATAIQTAVEIEPLIANDRLRMAVRRWNEFEVDRHAMVASAAVTAADEEAALAI